MTRETLRERVQRHLARRLVTRTLPLALDRATVSFTFDDIAVSAATTGAGLLEARGVRGTFYVCGALAGTAWDLYPLADLPTIGALARRGHEIGCHTATHPNGAFTGRAAYLRDVARNAALLEPVVGQAMTSFAYPYGAIGLLQKPALQERFLACRGIHGGVMRGRADRGRLDAVALEDGAIDEPGLDALLDAAVACRGWLVFYTHDVAERPTRFGVSPDRLAHALDGALARGCRIETVGGVCDRIAGRPPQEATGR